jgi:3'-phosphoadenosine 5'-phosphosulfate sulfotransferase (PAPS reductase)/FAD synthetase
MKNEVTLRPSYWASVSGGKDSLYMLNLILHNLDIYPLDGVVHFEMEIDYPFIHTVIDYMEECCKKANIPFVRIKPSYSWISMYEKYGFPTRKARWCNKLKIDANLQLENFMKSRGCYVVHYIGYCVDEEKRYKHKEGIKTERYPLVEQGIMEDTILEWAKDQPIFNHYYETQRRCGCMYCPMSSYISFAYLYKYYPENFDYMIGKMRETEVMRERELGRPFSCISSNPKYNADYLVHIIETKWLKRLNDKELENKQARSKWLDELLEDV